jgi:hypothetical protein
MADVDLAFVREIPEVTQRQPVRARLRPRARACERDDDRTSSAFQVANMFLGIKLHAEMFD